MNRTDFQALSLLRQREAHILLRSGYNAGAYYLAGYTVECALKASIAKQTRRYDFPDRKLAQKAHTHSLEQLLGLTGLKPDFKKAMDENSALELNWALVKDWNETSRYESDITEQAAKDLLSACTARKNGVLPWIRARW